LDGFLVTFFILLGSSPSPNLSRLVEFPLFSMLLFRRPNEDPDFQFLFSLPPLCCCFSSLSFSSLSRLFWDGRAVLTLSQVENLASPSLFHAFFFSRAT